jgi:hypothetical protein
MPRFEVEPGQLQCTSGQQAALAARLLEAQSLLQGAVTAAAGAAGDAGASGAMADAAAVWSSSLAGLASATSGLAHNLGAAADAYTATDARAMPAGK